MLHYLEKAAQWLMQPIDAVPAECLAEVGERYVIVPALEAVEHAVDPASARKVA